jgi:hypothetical protein
MNASELRGASVRLLAEAESHAAALRGLLEGRPAGLDYTALAEVFANAEAVCKRLAALRGLFPAEAGPGAGGAEPGAVPPAGATAEGH